MYIQLVSKLSYYESILGKAQGVVSLSWPILCAKTESTNVLCFVEGFIAKKINK